MVEGNHKNRRSHMGSGLHDIFHPFPFLYLLHRAGRWTLFAVGCSCKCVSGSCPVVFHGCGERVRGVYAFMYQYEELKDLYTLVCGQGLTIYRHQDRGWMCPPSTELGGGGVQNWQIFVEIAARP